MGPGKRVTVARVASRYSVLRLPEDLGFQTGLLIRRWTPRDGVTAAFIFLVYDIHGDVSLCTPSTEIRYDITSRATAVGGKPLVVALPACSSHTTAFGGP